MSVLRHDPVQKRWVIIAVERGRRPSDFKEEHKQRDDLAQNPACPFCWGNEDKTPNEIIGIRPDKSGKDEPGWTLRVIPNKFPALQIEGEVTRSGKGLYDTISGVGAHEVIIETPHHSRHMGDMDLDSLTDVVTVYRDRITDLYKDKRLRYALVFKNHGKTAGASLEHPHTQLIATPITPRTIAQELDSAKEHFKDKERCLFCDILDQELALEERIVFQTTNFVAFCPFASRFPFEMRVLPKQHSHDYTMMQDHELREFAFVMKTVLLALRRSLDDPAYNFMLHTAPNPVHRPGKPSYWTTLPFDWHWHLEIIPRLTRVAGFEWGTGFYINPTPPEVAAAYLKDMVEKIEEERSQEDL